MNTGVTWATKNLLRFNQLEQVLHAGIEEYGADWFYELIPILLDFRDHPNVNFDINTVFEDRHNHTLLSLAGHGSFYGAMEILLDYGANPTDQTMLRCVRMGDVQCLEILLDAGADPLAEEAKDELVLCHNRRLSLVRQPHSVVSEHLQVGTNSSRSCPINRASALHQDVSSAARSSQRPPSC